MQRNVIIAIVLILVLGGIAAYFFQNKTASVTKTTNPVQNTVATTIEDALSKTGSMTCDYSASGANYKTYIKNGKVRSDVTSNDAKAAQSVLMIDKKIYFWNAQGAYVMEIPDVTVTPGAKQDVSKKDEMMANLNQYKQYCKAAVLDDSLFVIPTNVKFQDYSKMMPKAPTGGAAMTEEQAKQYMQQYSKPQ